MSYSHPAIEFQAALKPGDKFTPIKDYAPHYGQVIEVVEMNHCYKNPDDCMYLVKVGETLDSVRCWWLRKCCERVD